MSAASTPSLEARAKRTHARRSCDVCKIRKTRCELPDLEVPSSSSPLPSDKACHRCKILGISCIVDDSDRRARKRTRDDGMGTPVSGRAAKPKRPSALPPASASAANPATIASLAALPGIDHTLDIMHGLNPDQISPTFALPHDASGPSRTVTLSNDSGEGYPVKAMRLHGRPLELVCAMLRVAYGKKAMKRPGIEEGYDLDLDALVHRDLRQRLEPGYAKLRALHPYLDTLSSLFNNYAQDPTPSNSLILAIVLYLSTLPLSPTDELAQLRTTLTPYITVVRDTVLLQLPQSFFALQALDLLVVHAPLGVLPAQASNPRSLAVARGQLGAIKAIAEALNIIQLIKHVVAISRLGSHLAWETTDIWLWLNMVSAEASLELENESIRKPAILTDARDVVESFLSNDYREVWSSALGGLSGTDLVGRLAVCDRVIRLAEVIESVLRIRNGLETAASDSNFDIVGSTIEEMKYLTERLDNIDTRHDAIMAIIAPMSQGIEAGWLAYRGLRRRYETNKVYVAGLRTLMATAYIPGHPLAFPGLPNDMQTVGRVSYAMARAQNPADIIPFIMAANNPATQATWTWGKHRGEICESTLATFAETGRMIVDHSQSDSTRILVPLHDIMCIAVESSKVLMEMQAGAIVMHRSSKRIQSPFRIPTWVYAMRQVSEVMRGISVWCPTGEGVSDNVESISTGCSNLVGSMCRLADEWERREQEAGQAKPEGPGDGAQAYPDTLHDYDSSTAIPTQQAQAASQGQNSAAPGVHSYMDTSDRWMASNHTTFDQGGYGATQQPNPVDVLLSHMFGYGYPANGEAQTNGVDGMPHYQQQQQQQHQEQHQPHQPHQQQQHQQQHQQHQHQHVHNPHDQHLGQMGAHGDGGMGDLSWPPQMQQHPQTGQMDGGLHSAPHQVGF